MLQLAADGLAAGFLDLGLQPGDTIAAWLPGDDADLVSEERDDWLVTINDGEGVTKRQQVVEKEDVKG